MASRRTPIDTREPSCERTAAELQIYSGDVRPESVTSRLEITPTSEVTLGEPSKYRNPENPPRGKVNAWFLSSEEKIESMDVRDHLDWLLERIIPRRDALLALQQEPGVLMSVYCPWWAKTGGGGPTLWPEQMRALADLNLECTFGFADYGPEE
jgi:hypothetical protein